jgi:hypothetical protein
MKMIVLLLLGAAGFSSARADEPAFRCAPERWSVAGVIDDGMFKGTLAQDCELHGTAGAGLAGLYVFLGEHAARECEVLAGPAVETFEELASRRFDLRCPSEAATLRNELHIAVDPRMRLVYAAYSREVNGRGVAALLRKLDVRFEIRPAAAPGAYTLHLENTVWLKKPDLVPNGPYIDGAARITLEQFRRARDRVLPGIAAHL